MKTENKYIIYVVALFFGILTGCMEDVKLGTDVKNAGKPILADISQWQKTASSITLTASVESTNGYPVTERGFCWSTTEFPDVEDDTIQVGEGKGEYTTTITDLHGKTKYYIRPYAKNQLGYGYGTQLEVDTNDGLGRVRTFAPYNLHATTAVCGGVITSPGEGSIQERGVTVSTSADMKTIIKTAPSTMEADSFVVNITGLTQSSRYYVQAYVKNTFGTFYGDNIAEFTTGDGRPKVDSVEVHPGYTYVALISRITDVGDAPYSSRGFYVSETPMPDTAAIRDAYQITALGTDLTFVGEKEDMKPQTRYYVCAFVTNEFGTGFSNPQEFYTLSETPTLQTLAPTSTVNGTVIVRGKVIQKGKSDILSAGICYSSTVVEPSLSHGEYVNVMPDASDIISVELSGWKGQTRYYVRVYATNSEGTSYGEVMTFETPPVYSGSLAAFPGMVRLQGSTAYFSIGGKGYLLGGDLGPQCTYELWSYNALDNYWQQLLPFPKGVIKWQTAVSYNTDVYVLGGIGSESEKRNDFSRYDSPNNMWYSMPIGPDSSYLRAGFLLGTEICFVGGMKDTAKNEVWAFEVGLRAWSQKVDFPIRQYGGIAVNINDTVYAGLGKSTTGICNKTLWKSTETLATWTQEPTCTAINGGILAGVAYKNKIYVIDEAYYIFEYDPSVQQWNTKSRLPVSNQNIHCMYVLNDMIYIGLGVNALITYNPLWDN